jgi:outer membrane lipoprotein-sorting protein
MYKYLIINCFCFLILNNLHAQPKDYKAVKDKDVFVKKFNEKSASIQTNESDFKQEKFLSIMTEKSVSKGKFYFKKSDKMRWENTEPVNNIIVLNDGKVYIKEKGKVKVFDSNTNKSFKSLNDIMLSTASGNILDNKDYTYMLYENEKYVLIVLTPLATTTKKYVKTIEMTVEKSDYTVSQLKMIEPSGDYTQMEFHNKKLNLGLNDNLFILK